MITPFAESVKPSRTAGSLTFTWKVSVAVSDPSLSGHCDTVTKPGGKWNPDAGAFTVSNVLPDRKALDATGFTRTSSNWLASVTPGGKLSVADTVTRSSPL